MSAWETLYYKDVFSLVKIEDIHPLLHQKIGDQEENYVLNSTTFISATENMWFLEMYPHYIPMTTFDIHKFYSMCYMMYKNYPYATHLTHHGIKVDSKALGDKEKEAIVSILTTLYHPSEDNQHWKKFSLIRDDINFVFGGRILTDYASVMPYYVDRSQGKVGLRSPYGRMLMGEEEVLKPIYVTQVPYVLFPDCIEMFSDEELETLDNTEDVWVNDKGVHVYVPYGDSSTSVAQSIRKVVSLRWISVRERYTTIPYEDKVGGDYRIDVHPAMRFSPLRYMDLLPEKYVKQYSSGIDYTAATTLTKGAFR